MYCKILMWFVMAVCKTAIKAYQTRIVHVTQFLYWKYLLIGGEGEPKLGDSLQLLSKLPNRINGFLERTCAEHIVWNIYAMPRLANKFTFQT